MPLIGVKDSGHIRRYFEEKLTGPVTIDCFTRREDAFLPEHARECLYCPETETLVEEVAALSPRIHVNLHDPSKETPGAEGQEVSRVPAIFLTGRARGRVRFFGIPSGYGFSSLIEGLVDVAGGVTDLPAEARAELEALGRDVHIQVFSTPT